MDLYDGHRRSNLRIMSDRDDRFRPRLGRIRSRRSGRSQSYLTRVVREMSSAGPAGFGRTIGTERFTGYRIGRGNDPGRYHRAGRRFGPSYRRVVIKTRLVKFRAGGLAAARAHLRYLQRDGVSQAKEPGELYDRESDRADGKAFLDRCDGDRHQFRFIVSAEDAAELADLKPFVRDLMGAMERDLGTRLDWVAVDHFNTDNPHSHIVLRGKDEHGKDLIIARDYIKHGMRRRASELVTLELGPQTEREFTRKLERQVAQQRFTDLDRGLIQAATNGIVDMYSMPMRDWDRDKRMLQIGRLQVLARRGLALEEETGLWRLSPKLEETLRRAGERGDIIKTMHRDLKEAGLEAGVAEFSIYDPVDPGARTITGQIVGRGLHDELNDGHYVLIDGTDGRLHHVALDPRQEMEDLAVGAILEVRPASPGPKPADLVIEEVARRHGGRYSPEAHMEFDRQASPAFIQAHIRRLEALRRQHVLRRLADESWEVPEDFADRITETTRASRRYPGQINLLSAVSLDTQINAQGATWLDRQLVAKDPVPLRGERFGRAVDEALRQRQACLLEEGLAMREGAGIRYKQNVLALLRRREVLAAGETLSKEFGVPFVEPEEGERFQGVYRRPVNLASGKFALIEKSQEFTLVPWRAALERQRGRMISGVMRGNNLSFDVARRRGLQRG